MLTIQLDQILQDDISWVIGLVYVDSPEAARAVLSTIASSMITVAGVVFSLTMVVLSLTSQQYGSLVLVDFMRDRVNQSVLGVFTATFIYCLLILRTIRGVEDSVFIPHLSVLLGLFLSITSFAVLIFYIHHVSESIQASRIIGRIGHNLLEAVEDLFPEPMGYSSESSQDRQEIFELAIQNRHEVKVQSREQGYVQFVDDEALFKFAEQQDLIIELQEQPGQFVVQGDVLAVVWTQDIQIEECENKINNVFVLGTERTPGQDIEFIITQLSSVAVRALSPSINDPYTAVQCIDRFEGVFCRLVNRHFPSEYRYSASGHLCVIAHSSSFSRLLNIAFGEICHYGREDQMVMKAVLSALEVISKRAQNDEYQSVLKQFISKVNQQRRDTQYVF